MSEVHTPRGPFVPTERNGVVRAATARLQTTGAVVLTGPAGVGKTFVARLVSDAFLAGCKSESCVANHQPLVVSLATSEAFESLVQREPAPPVAVFTDVPWTEPLVAWLRSPRFPTIVTTRRRHPNVDALDVVPLSIAAAAELLIDVAARRSVSIRPEAAASVARHLDGLPAAVKLAAAALSVLTPSELEARFISAEAGTLDPTHTVRRRSLDGLIDDSFHGLDELARSVLVGVASAAGPVRLVDVAAWIDPAPDVLALADARSQLLDAYLVRVERNHDGVEQMTVPYALRRRIELMYAQQCEVARGQVAEHHRARLVRLLARPTPTESFDELRASYSAVVRITPHARSRDRDEARLLVGEVHDAALDTTLAAELDVLGPAVPPDEGLDPELSDYWCAAMHGSATTHLELGPNLAPERALRRISAVRRVVGSTLDLLTVAEETERRFRCENGSSDAWILRARVEAELIRSDLDPEPRDVTKLPEHHPWPALSLRLAELRWKQAYSQGQTNRAHELARLAMGESEWTAALTASASSWKAFAPPRTGPTSSRWALWLRFLAGKATGLPVWTGRSWNWELMQLKEHDQAPFFSPDFSSVRLPNGQKISLASQPILHRVLAFVCATTSSDRPATPEAVFAAGWPGDRVSSDSAQRRVHSTIYRLRQLGLGPWLHGSRTGYWYSSTREGSSPNLEHIEE